MAGILSGGDTLRFISNLLFWVANFSLIIAVVFLEVGTRYMRRKMDSKRKKADRMAMKFLIFSGVMYLLSYLFSLF